MASTTKVEIYTWSTCPFCIRALALLKRKGVEFQEYCLDGDHQGKEAMAARANGRSSVPQIFINDQSIGGCNELYALESEGKLDQLLA